MPLPRIISEDAKLSKLTADLADCVHAADLSIQHVFSSHLILAGAGHVEHSIIHVLSEYGRIHGNLVIKRYIEKSVSRNNSLNCEKIETICNQFSSAWWSELEETTLQVERDAVDSLKTLRDQVAHGQRNGTGYSVVKGYVQNAKSFVRKFSVVVLGH